MNKGKKLYEGKAKIIYETKDKNLVIQHFKDDATAFNNLKKSSVVGKGVLNNKRWLERPRWQEVPTWQTWQTLPEAPK